MPLDTPPSQTICFSGPRPQKLGAYRMDSLLIVEISNELYAHLRHLIVDRGYRQFISGMALGFDTIASLVVLRLREEFGSIISLHAQLPCHDQDSVWTSSLDRERYREILAQADSITYSVDGEYVDGCLLKRNIDMLNQSGLLVALYGDTRGGTLHAITNAKKKKMEIHILDPRNIPLGFVIEKRR